jgi:hypothetical protein
MSAAEGIDQPSADVPADTEQHEAGAEQDRERHVRHLDDALPLSLQVK